MSTVARDPLATLLALRRREEAGAAAAVTRAVAEVDLCAARHDVAIRHAAARRARARAAAPGAGAATVWLAVELGRRAVFAERLRGQALALETAARQAAGAAEEAGTALADARRAHAAARAAVRALERRRERWRTEVGRVRARRGEADEEEAVSAWRAAR